MAMATPSSSLEALHREGNALVSEGSYREALSKYAAALALVAPTADPEDASTKKAATLRCNRALCCLKLDPPMPELALAEAEKCQELRPEWPKAYFRKAAALEALGRLGEARLALCYARRLAPTDGELRSALANLSAKLFETRGAVGAKVGEALETLEDFSHPPNVTKAAAQSLRDLLAPLEKGGTASELDREVAIRSFVEAKGGDTVFRRQNAMGDHWKEECKNGTMSLLSQIVSLAPQLEQELVELNHQAESKENGDGCKDAEPHAKAKGPPPPPQPTARRADRPKTRKAQPLGSSFLEFGSEAPDPDAGAEAAAADSSGSPRELATTTKKPSEGITKESAPPPPPPVPSTATPAPSDLLSPPEAGAASQPCDAAKLAAVPPPTLKSSFEPPSRRPASHEVRQQPQQHPELREDLWRSLVMAYLPPPSPSASSSSRKQPPVCSPTFAKLAAASRDWSRAARQLVSCEDTVAAQTWLYWAGQQFRGLPEDLERPEIGRNLLLWQRRRAAKLENFGEFGFGSMDGPKLPTFSLADWLFVVELHREDRLLWSRCLSSAELLTSEAKSIDEPTLLEASDIILPGDIRRLSVAGAVAATTAAHREGREPEGHVVSLAVVHRPSGRLLSLPASLVVGSRRLNNNNSSNNNNKNNKSNNNCSNSDSNTNSCAVTTASFPPALRKTVSENTKDVPLLHALAGLGWREPSSSSKKGGAPVPPGSVQVELGLSFVTPDGRFVHSSAVLAALLEASVARLAATK